MYLEGHSTVDNLRNYMVQVSESSASFDASFTLTEKVVGRWIALQALASLWEGIIIMLNLEKAVKKAMHSLHKAHSQKLSLFYRSQPYI